MVVFNLKNDGSSGSRCVTSKDDFRFNENGVSGADELIDWVNIVVLVQSFGEVSWFLINFDRSVQISDLYGFRGLRSGLWFGLRNRLGLGLGLRLGFRNGFWLWHRFGLLDNFFNFLVLENSGCSVFIGGSGHDI